MASRILTKSIRALALKSMPTRLTTTGYLYNKMPHQLSPILSHRSMQTTGVVGQDSVVKDLASFIAAEVKLERDSRKDKSQLAKITGFELKTEGPNVTLTKKHGNEQITITFNVNGSLDDDQSMEPSMANEKAAETQQEAEVI